MRPDNCPHCNSSLLGEPVPEKYLTHKDDCEGGRCFCLPYGDITHFRREISVEIRGVYDGGLFWQCPDCDGRWHRWPEGHYLRQRAEMYVQGRA